MFRILLKNMLAGLTKWAIKKHDIEVIAILGERYSRLTSYVLWELLRDDYFTRCQWDRSFWDLSIPLTVLGYDSRQRSVFGWLGVLIRATFVLLTQTSRSQKIILHIPYSLPEIVSYWLSTVHPTHVVVFGDNISDKVLDQVKSFDSNIYIINGESESSTQDKYTKIVGSNWVEKKGIKYALPGVFWNKPIRAASYIADLYGIKPEEINKILKSIEPDTFLKIREQLKVDQEI